MAAISSYVSWKVEAYAALISNSSKAFCAWHDPVRLLLMLGIECVVQARCGLLASNFTQSGNSALRNALIEQSITGGLNLGLVLRFAAISAHGQRSSQRLPKADGDLVPRHFA